MSKETYIVSKETYIVSKETYIVSKETYQRHYRYSYSVKKETYYSAKRDLLKALKVLKLHSRETGWALYFNTSTRELPSEPRTLKGFRV